MGHETDTNGDDVRTALVAAFSEFGGDSLRDVWLFDESDFEPLYLRDDVEEKLASVDVSKFIDNERYGFVTRETYDQLYYASYRYTVRGFDDFEQFRTFVEDDDAHVGVFASLDQRSGGYEYATLDAHVQDIVSGYELATLSPSE
ncbi:DUF7522 family protein [Halomicrococcus gelatinilyticus]|uniref:DUF7522 family protein n=1 Tax=Halomicrococcus gelatinilyticus TaxID=1702103 RepID=UPI002E161A27